MFFLSAHIASNIFRRWIIYIHMRNLSEYKPGCTCTCRLAVAVIRSRCKHTTYFKISIRGITKQGFPQGREKPDWSVTSHLRLRSWTQAPAKREKERHKNKATPQCSTTVPAGSATVFFWFQGRTPEAFPTPAVLRWRLTLRGLSSGAVEWPLNVADAAETPGSPLTAPPSWAMRGDGWFPWRVEGRRVSC